MQTTRFTERGVLMKGSMKNSKKTSIQPDHTNVSFDSQAANSASEQSTATMPTRETDGQQSIFLSNQDEISKNSNYQFESNRKYFSICIYALCVIFIGTFLIYCIMNMEKTKAALLALISALSPFLIAFFIAYVLNPIVIKIKSFLEQSLKIRSSKATKALSIVLTYLLVLGIVAVTLLYVVPELGKSLSELSVKFQAIGTELIRILQAIEDSYPNLDLAVFEEKVSSFLLQLVSLGPDMVIEIIPVILNFSVSIVRLAINLLLSIVISVYMLNDKKIITRNITRTMYAFFKKDNVDAFIQNAKECNSIFSNFIIGKSLDSLIIGLICFVLMVLLKLPYSVLLSVIVGLTNMIPYFGPFIGAIPGILLFLVIDPVKAIIFAIMILALQQFDGLYLGPKILGNSTGLKPLWVIFAITIGGAYAGVLGMFLGVPIVGVIAYLLNKTITDRLRRKNITVDEE